MSKPTGKLALAYQTIAILEAKVASLEASLATQPAAGERVKSRHRQEMDDLRQERERSMAAQPAAVDPVAWIVESPKDLEPVTSVCKSKDQAERFALMHWTVTPVYAAPPAAAHGDEAELRRQLAEAVDFLTRLNRSRSYKGMLSIMLDAKEFLNRRRVAMRAQGDGEVQ